MKRNINHAGRAHLQHRALLVLALAWLLVCLPSAHAAPVRQDDPAVQCAEGVKLGAEGNVIAALPLLEKGFAGREKARFARPDDLGRCASWLGYLRSNIGNQNGALEAYSVALEMFRQSNDRIDEGTTLNNLGLVYSNQGQYAQALAHYQQALVIRRAVGDRAGEGYTLNNFGEVYRKQGYYAQALKYYQQALLIMREVGDHANEATALHNMGAVYADQGNCGKALEYYQQALLIERAVGDRAGEGATLNSLGLVYHVQGQYTKALSYYEQALLIERAVDDRAGEGTTLNNLGGVYHDQGRQAKALTYYQQALVIRREVSDRQGEGATLHNLGGIYAARGQYAQALDTLQQALVIRREVGDRAGEGATLNNLGSVYATRGQYAQALDTLQQAVVIEHAVGDRAAEGATLHNLGAVYVDQGHDEKALEYYQQALVIRREVGDRAGEGATLNGLGSVYHTQGQYEKALEYYQQALVIQLDTGDRVGEGATLNGIGFVYRTQGQYAQAMAHYQQALIIRREVGDRAGESITLNNLGAIYQIQGQYESAMEYYQQAMDIRDQVRASAGSEQARASFIAQYADLYTYAAALAHQQGQHELAFQISERSRARTFLDSLATGYVQLSDNEAQALLTREQEAYAARQAAQDALAKARAARSLDETLVAELEQQLTNAEHAYDVALDAIEQRGDELAALVPSRTKGVLAVTDVQALLNADTTLVSFFVADEQTLAFVLTRERFTTVALPIKRADLDAQVRALRLFANTTEPYPPAAVQLYQALITPLKTQLTTPHLVIVPHGVLHYLPFAALTDDQRFLIDDYTLSVLPSASSLAFVQQNVGRPAAAPLILGNPATTEPGLKTLHFAEAEAHAIADLYAVEPLLGSAATEDALVQQAGQAGIVHLAVHGSFNPVVPLASAVYLAPETTTDESDPSQDGRLEVGEIYGIDLNKADLVVLSACQTQLGELSAGDEVVGLTRALIFAGTPSVIASLWSVDDQATGLLMERFYTHLRAGLGKAEALRLAQLEVRKKYPSPYFWAGFVLSGDPGAVHTMERVQIPAALPWLVGGGLLAAAALVGGALFVWRGIRRRRRQGPVPSAVAAAGSTAMPVEPEDLLAALLAQAEPPERASPGGRRTQHDDGE